MTDMTGDASTPETTNVELDLLGTYTGRSLGQSSWYPITQERVDVFADATADHQWIHIDPVRAKDGPFGQTLARGRLHDDNLRSMLLGRGENLPIGRKGDRLTAAATEFADRF